MVPGQALFGGDPLDERLIIGRAPEVDDRDLVPRAEVFAAQLDRLASCEREIAAVEEPALRSALPGNTFRVVQEHKGRVSGQQETANPESYEDRDEQSA